MKYKIDWSEKKTTSTGKAMMIATLLTEDGTTIEKVTIWGDFPNFSNLMTGNDVEGTIQEKQNGNFLNKTLYPVKPPASAPQGSKTTSITKAMDKKQEFIKGAQENRAEGIKISSTFRDATLISVAQLGSADDVIFKETWLKWREWLWQNYDVDDSKFPPFQ